MEGPQAVDAPGRWAFTENWSARDGLPELCVFYDNRVVMRVTRANGGWNLDLDRMRRLSCELRDFMQMMLLLSDRVNDIDPPKRG